MHNFLKGLVSMRKNMAFSIVLVIILSSVGFAQYNSVRPFRCHIYTWDSLANEALIKVAQKYNYNFIQVPFDTLSCNYMTRWMKLAVKRKIKIIPELPFMDAYGTDMRTRTKIPTLELNIGKYGKGITEPSQFGYPSLAPDPLFDNWWNRLLDSLNAATVAAKCTLQYVNIDHGEICERASILIGGGVADRRFSASKYDTAYVDSLVRKGDSAQTAIGKLLINEIFRRMSSVSTRIHTLSNPKVIIYADAFDPQANGRDSAQTCLSNPVGTLVQTQMSWPTTSASVLTSPAAFKDTLYTNKVYLPSFLVTDRKSVV